MNKEKIQHHISHLQEKHDELDTRITNAQKTHGDEHIIKVLKKRKVGTQR